MDPHLLIKYINGNASEKEKEEFMLWLHADDTHMREYLALRKIHAMTLWHQPETTRIDSGIFSRVRKLSLQFMKAACVLAILSGFYYFYIQDVSPEASANLQTIHVPAGQRVELYLSDGTHVWLNAGSTFVFPGHFNDNNRTVTLDGEGYFAVTKDESAPFTVKTPRHDITVLGTEFNVAAYSKSDLFEASLITGSIEVHSHINGEKALLTSPRKVVSRNGRLVQAPADDNNYFLWKEGILSFDDATVETIFRKMELCFEIEMDVVNKGILQEKYTAKFRTKNGPEHILRVLQLRSKFKYEMDDENNVIVIR